MRLRPGTYELGPSGGGLEVRTRRDGVAARAGHDLVLGVRHWSARLVVDTTVVLTATVDASSLEVREASGGVKPLTDRDRADILENIARKVLLTDRHPEITFASTSVEAGDGALVVAGDLSIVGTTRPVRFVVTAEPTEGEVVLRTTVTFAQSLWGIRPFSALLGTLKVADGVTVVAEVRLAG